jgi:hypothetical protein
MYEGHQKAPSIESKIAHAKTKKEKVNQNHPVKAEGNNILKY